MRHAAPFAAKEPTAVAVKLEDIRKVALALPDTTDKVLGVRARLPLARKATVLSLVRQAYAFKLGR